MHDSDDDTGAQMEMPRYVSHKKVWALEIAAIMHNDDGSHVLGFSDPGYASLKVPASFSPRKAFLEGYTREP